MMMPLLFASAVLFATHQNGYRMVSVHDCSGRWARIYVDAQRTTPLPNPFVSDSNGNFRFFTKGCVEVSSEESR